MIARPAASVRGAQPRRRSNTRSEAGAAERKTPTIKCHDRRRARAAVQLLSEVLLHHPGLTARIVDAPGVLDSARRLLAARGVADRVELVAGSFFDSVPAGADAYLLKNVLHDWDDDRSSKILRNCRLAMAPGQRLLIIEQLVEADSEHPATMVDLHMRVVCGEGRERARADFERLLAATGFRLARVFTAPTGMSILEGVAT